METKELFKSEFMCWDDVSHLGAEERNAVILNDGRIKQSSYSADKTNFVITIQLSKNYEIFDFRVNKKTWRNLKEVWGTESGNWREKRVKVEPYVYREGKTGLQLIPLISSIPKLTDDLELLSGRVNKIPERFKEMDDSEILNDYIEKIKKAFNDSKQT